jgi:hypothetical protein
MNSLCNLFTLHFSHKNPADLTIEGGAAGQPPANLYCFADINIPPVEDPIGA